MGLNIDKCETSDDNLQCEQCERYKEDVVETICPYNKDLRGLIVSCKLCVDCYNQRVMDV